MLENTEEKWNEKWLDNINKLIRMEYDIDLTTKRTVQILLWLKWLLRSILAYIIPCIQQNAHDIIHLIGLELRTGTRMEWQNSHELVRGVSLETITVTKI